MNPVGRGINQQLKCDLRTAAIARHLRHYRCQITAGTVATDRDSLGVNADRRRIVGYPFGRGVTVLRRGRELVLGRKPVVH